MYKSDSDSGMDEDFSHHHRTYENTLAQIVETTKFPAIYQFPSDNIVVTDEDVQRPRGFPVIPTDAQQIMYDSTDPTYITEVFRYFKQKNRTVKHLYKDYKKVYIESSLFKEQRFDIDTEILEKEQQKEAEASGNVASPVPDEDIQLDIDMSLIKSSVDDVRAMTQSENRAKKNIFKMYDMSTAYAEYEWNGGAEVNICKRVNKQKPMALTLNDPIAIEVQSFKTGIGEKFGSEFEPLFYSLALYDVQAKRRVSETFYFDFNTNEMMTEVCGGVNNDEVSTIKRAVFHVSQRHSNIMLVMKVMKVLQGDEDSAIEPYIKAEKLKENDLTKLRKSIKDSGARLGKFRQLLAWTMVPVFDDDEKLILADTLRPFFRAKGNLSDSSFMDLFKEGDNTLRKKIINASCSIRVAELVGFETSYKPNGIIECTDDSESITAMPIREFHQQALLKFNNHYENVMYIYPERLLLAARGTISTSSKSIAIAIQLRESDDDLETTPGLNVFYGRSHEAPITSLVYSAITYHSRNPEFGDEFKVELPVILTPQHHLLFTFYHISCQNKSGKETQTPVGYAVLPIFGNGHLISGAQSLPVIADFGTKKNYLSHEVRKSAKYLESGKQIFSFTLNSISTIYPLDQHIAHFYNRYPLIYKNPADTASPRTSLQWGSGEGTSSASYSTSGYLASPSLGVHSAMGSLDSSSPQSFSPSPSPSPLVDSPAQSNSLRAVSFGGSVAYGSGNRPGMGPATGNENLLSSVILGLEKASTVMILQHLPIVLNQLLRIICSEYNNAKTAAFKVLIKLIDKVAAEFDEGPRNSLLVQYVAKIFTNFETKDESVPGNHRYVFEELPAVWLEHLYHCAKVRSERQGTGEHTPTVRSFRAHKDDKSETLPLTYSWFLFDLIYKSMVLYLHDSGYLTNQSGGFEPPAIRMNRFSENLRRVLSMFVPTLTEEIIYRSEEHLNLAKMLNSNLALFIRELFNVMDRGFALTLAQEYIKHVSSRPLVAKNIGVLKELRSVFLSVLVDHEHYIPLSLPNPPSSITDVQAIGSASSDGVSLDDSYKGSLLPYQMNMQHYLCGVFIDKINDDLRYRERTGRSHTIFLLRDLLSKHDYDVRYQDPEVKQRIAGMYFPIVLNFLDIYEQFMSVPEKINEYSAAVERCTEDLTEKEAKLSVHQDDNPQLPSTGNVYVAGGASANTSNNEASNAKQSLVAQLQKQVDDARAALKEAKNQLAAEEKKYMMDEKKPMFACILFILQHMDRKLLRSWWKGEILSRIKTFIQVLVSIVSTFEYSGRDSITQKALTMNDTSAAVNSLHTKSTIEEMYSSLNTGGSGKRSFRSGGSLRERKATGTGTGTRNFKLKQNTYGSIGPQGKRIGRLGTGTGTGNLDTFFDPSSDETKDVISKMMIWEGNLSVESSLSVMDIVLDFLEDFEDELLSYSSDTMSNIFHLITLFIKLNQSESALQCAYALVRNFIARFRPVIFRLSTPYSQTLCKEVLHHCHSSNQVVCLHSAAVLYALIKNNYLEMGNFSKTKIQTTVALSNLAGEIELKNQKFLRASFAAVANFAKCDSFKPDAIPAVNRRSQSIDYGSTPIKRFDADFPEQVKELTERLGKTLLDSVKIKSLEKTKADTELMADLYFRIAMGYRHAPELSVTWLSNLAQYHKKLGKWVEAAMCVVHIAAVSFDYLRIKGISRLEAADFSHFLKVAPALNNRKELVEDLHAILSENEAHEFQSNAFTESGFLSLLEEAIEYLNKAEYYEHAIEIYKLLAAIYERARNYDALQPIHSNIASLYAAISRANLKNARLFGMYYRVTFAGKMFDSEINGRELIYKMPKITRLAETKDYLESFLFARYGEGKVKLVRDNQVLDRSKMDDDVAYYQITSLLPYFGNEPNDNSRVTPFERGSNITQFIFETPFTKSGKNHGQLSDQCKRKTILTIPKAFPYMLNRLEVSERVDIVLEPIENSIETIELTLRRIADEIREPPNINSLQMVLSGSIIPQVNEGIPQIVKTFLSSCESIADAESKFGQQHVTKLRLRMREFLDVCHRAVKLGKKFVKPEQLAFHNQIEKGYQTIRELFSPYTTGDDIVLDTATALTPFAVTVDGGYKELPKASVSFARLGGAKAASAADNQRASVVPAMQQIPTSSAMSSGGSLRVKKKTVQFA